MKTVKVCFVFIILYGFVSMKPLPNENVNIDSIDVKEIITHRIKRDNSEDKFIFPFLNAGNVTVISDINEEDGEENVDVIIGPRVDEIDEAVICSLLGRCADKEEKEN